MLYGFIYVYLFDIIFHVYKYIGYIAYAYIYASDLSSQSWWRVPLFEAAEPSEIRRLRVCACGVCVGGYVRCWA